MNTITINETKINIGSMAVFKAGFWLSVGLTWGILGSVGLLLFIARLVESL